MCCVAETAFPVTEAEAFGLSFFPDGEAPLGFGRGEAGRDSYEEGLPRGPGSAGGDFGLGDGPAGFTPVLLSPFAYASVRSCR